MHILQVNKDGFKDAMRGVWNSLWPALKEDLSKKIGDHERNELFFDELLEEVLEIDLKEVLTKRKETRRDAEIKACEYINNKILEVLRDNKLLYGRGEMPVYGMRKRTL